MIAGGVWWFWYGHRKVVAPAHPDISAPDNVELRFNHVRFRGMSNGKIFWELTADHIDFSADQTTCRVNGVKKMALIKDTKQELTVSADTIERNSLTGDISIGNNVTVMGTDIIMKTPFVSWNDRRQALLIPGRIGAQLGDITVNSTQGAEFDILQGSLHCNGSVTIGTEGNILHAGGGVLVENGGKRLTLFGPITASFLIDDVQQWAAGQGLPKIPAIPQQVKDRYRQFFLHQGGH